ncbi:hypothetical protein JTE90_021069 [Oedothorax gibbosus]|uniref:Uncharacterized protein n=1 Tax=Oedothorax gibbosus TaxID=931172 RepID=A0AAV6VQN7_9ARAC|nr:hypothetical protein JTE90_021069 [Oedothorax gibbosus]
MGGEGLLQEKANTRIRKSAMKSNDCLSIQGAPLAGEAKPIKSDPIFGWVHQFLLLRSYVSLDCVDAPRAQLGRLALVVIGGN